MRAQKLSFLTLFVVLVSMMLSGCGGSSGSVARFVHAVVDGGRFDVLVNDRVVASDVRFRTATQYLGIDSGAVTVKLRQTGTSTIVLTRNLTVNAGDEFTIVFSGFVNPVGGEPSLQARTFSDDRSEPDENKYEVRVIHSAGSTDLSPADLYINRTNQNQNGTNPVFTNLDFGDVTGYRQFDTGTRRIIVTQSGSKANVFYDSQGDDVTFGNKSKRTLVLVDGPDVNEMARPIILADRN
ncbi:MAG: DUF4397 domain-containing protein [Fimbriimonadaceae bacterium]|nr:MAG: DUF4397 domain-containing protein [Fimbriimonadaceae bacterium]